MMGSRVAGVLLRRAKGQTPTLIPRFPKGNPSPFSPPSRAGSNSGHHVLPSPARYFSISSAREAAPRCGECLFSRFASSHAFRSLAPKENVHHCGSVNSNMVNGAANSGLKLLVTKGPQPQKVVGIWLFGCAAWVFRLVILVGVTRLTRSGLSMTDWKFTGSLPSLSDDQWRLEFKKYKQSPEYTR